MEVWMSLRNQNRNKLCLPWSLSPGTSGKNFGNSTQQKEKKPNDGGGKESDGGSSMCRTQSPAVIRSNVYMQE